MTGIIEYLHQNYLVSKGELCSARSFDFMEKIERRFYFQPQLSFMLQQTTEYNGKIKTNNVIFREGIYFLLTSMPLA